MLSSMPCVGSYYDVLDVPRKASVKEIKSAYRKAALKIHPDVNSAPDAKDRFMEAKAAFETLADEGKRAEYDRRLRMGFESSQNHPGSSGGSGGYSNSSNTKQQRPRANETEDKYSFDDLLRDLDKEINDWASTKAAKRGTSKPSTLWDELEMIGEELVEFLEDTIIGADEGKSQSQAKTGSRDPPRTTSASYSETSSREATDYTSKDWYKNYESESPASSQSPSSRESESGQERQKRPQSSPNPKPVDDIEDMLASLKKKYNK